LEKEKEASLLGREYTITKTQALEARNAKFIVRSSIHPDTNELVP